MSDLYNNSVNNTDPVPFSTKPVPPGDPAPIPLSKGETIPAEAPIPLSKGEAIPAEAPIPLSKGEKAAAEAPIPMNGAAPKAKPVNPVPQANPVQPKPVNHIPQAGPVQPKPVNHIPQAGPVQPKPVNPVPQAGPVPQPKPVNPVPQVNPVPENRASADHNAQPMPGDMHQYSSHTFRGEPVPPRNTYTYSHGSTAAPEKPKKHIGLKIAAFVLSLVVVAVGAVQVYKFMDDSRLVDNNQEPNKPLSSVTTMPNGSGSSSSEQNNETVPSPDPLPGLFELASRKDAKPIPDIVDEIMPSVVGISSTFEISESYSSWGWGYPSSPQKRQAVATGTGIVMKEDGYILTNAHVIYDSSEYRSGEAVAVSILFSDEKEYDAKIYAYDVETDLAVLKVDGSGFKAAEFGNSDELRIGELVIAVGNPLGFELFGSVTSGIVSAVDRKLSINDQSLSLIQTDTAINAGNSGGPLLNSCGQVIGINSSKLSASYGSTSIEGLGFAIPINEAKVIIDDLINYRHVLGRPKIGISTADVTESYSNYLGLPMGVYVKSVEKGSAAAEAGIKEGDIIIGINDEAITTTDELNAAKNKFRAGDTITLKINRNGSDMDVSLTLHDANEDAE